MTNKRKRDHKVTIASAHAWLVTVVNPLLRGLRIEEDYLGRKAWTWRFHLQRCEVLDRCQDMIPSEYEDNFEDLLGRKPDLDRLVQEHDARLASLQAAFLQAQTQIERSLSRETQRALAKHKATHPTDHPTGAFNAEQLPSLVAQFVLNNVTMDLTAADSTMHAFWNSFGAEFLKSRTTKFAAEVAVVDQAGDALIGSVRKVAKAIRKIRAELCDEYGLPPVPVSIGRQVRFSEQF